MSITSRACSGMKSIEMDFSLKEVSFYLVTPKGLSAFCSQISQCSTVVGELWVNRKSRHRGKLSQ